MAYVVIRDPRAGQDFQAVVHQSRDAAESEALRLAGHEPGVMYFVCLVVSGAALPTEDARLSNYAVAVEQGTILPCPLDKPDIPF